jgi:CRP-like cAMP-binding protein
MKVHIMNESEIIAVLEGCEFFKKMGLGDLQKISSLCQISEHQAGDYVFRQGDYGDRLYVISEGHVVLERSVDLGQRKGNVLIAHLGKGRMFGCWSTLIDVPHILMSNAVCQKPSRIISLKGSNLRAMMEADKEAGFKLLERLCFLLRDRIQAAYGAMDRI